MKMCGSLYCLKIVPIFAGTGSGLHCPKILISTYASRVKFHKSSFWVLVLAAGGPYWVSISQKNGSLLGPYLKAWGSLIVLPTVLCLHSSHFAGPFLSLATSLTSSPLSLIPAHFVHLHVLCLPLPPSSSYNPLEGVLAQADCSG